MSLNTTISYEHAFIHAGKHWFLSDYDSDQDAGVPKYWRLTVADSTIRNHVLFNFQASNYVVIEIYENPTLDAAGTALTFRNNNRNLSTTPTSLTAYYDTTTTVDGTLIYSAIIGSDSGTGSSGDHVGGIHSREFEFILKNNEDYIIKVTPGFDNTDLVFELSLYERPA